MNGFLRNFLEKYMRFMQGRYGGDELSRFLAIAAFVLMIIAWVPGLRFLYYVSLAMLAFSVYRSMSRNISRRQRERMFYLRHSEGIRNFFSFQKSKHSDREHILFLCPGCSKTLRVPKGKGTLKVTCPHCGAVTYKKTGK